MEKIVKFNVEELRKNATKFLMGNGEAIKEATNGGIARYMMAPIEDGGLGMKSQRSTIFRRLRSGKEEFTLKIEDKDNKTYEEKVKLAYEYLNEEKFSSGDKVKKEDIIRIAEYSGFSPRQVAIKVLRIDSSVADGLLAGKYETASINMKPKYDDLSLQEKMQKTKELFEKTAEIRLYTYDEIKQISEEFQIPEKLVVVGILNKDAKMYESLSRGKISSVRYEGPIPEYKNPESSIFIGVLTPQDMEESIFENQEFFEEQLQDCKTREDLEIAIAGTNKYLEEKREGMERRYDGLYDQLLEQYKKDPIINSPDYSERKQYYTNYQEEYMLELKEILKRNPRYGTKILTEDMEKISKDFGFKTSLFHGVITGKKGKKNTFYAGKNATELQPKKRISLPKKFQEIMAEEIQSTTDNVMGPFAVSNNLDKNRREDMQSQLILSMLEYGGNVIFYEKETRTMEENMGMLGGYVRRIANYKIFEAINERNELTMQSGDRNGEEIEEDRNRRNADKSRNTEKEAIESFYENQRTITEDECVELANFDLEMLELLVDEENTALLETFAKKIDMDKENLRKKAESWVERLRGE